MEGGMREDARAAFHTIYGNAEIIYEYTWDDGCPGFYFQEWCGDSVKLAHAKYHPHTDHIEVLHEARLVPKQVERLAQFVDGRVEVEKDRKIAEPMALYEENPFLVLYGTAFDFKYGNPISEPAKTMDELASVRSKLKRGVLSMSYVRVEKESD